MTPKSITLGKRQCFEFTICYSFSYYPSTFVHEQTLITYCFVKSTFLILFRNCQFRCSTKHWRVIIVQIITQLYYYYSPQNLYSSLAGVLFCPVFMSVRKPENSDAYYSMEIRILMEKGFVTTLYQLTLYG